MSKQKLSNLLTSELLAPEKHQYFIEKFKKVYMSKNTNDLQLQKNDKKQKRYKIKIITQMVKKCRHQEPNYTKRCLKNLLTLKQSKTSKNSEWIKQAIESLTSFPLVLTNEEKQRAIRAVYRCEKSLNTDDFDKKNKMIKHLTRLSYSNSFEVRNGAKNSLQSLENRHHVNCNHALEESLMEIEKNKVAILQDPENSFHNYEKIVYYLDSFSPRIRHSAQEAFKQTMKYFTK